MTNEYTRVEQHLCPMCTAKMKKISKKNTYYFKCPKCGYIETMEDVTD